MQAAQLARALGAKRSGRQYSCRCPAHEDSAPSLIFWDGHTSIRFKCYAGCEPEDVIAVLRRKGLWHATNFAVCDNRHKTVPQNKSEQSRSVLHRDLALGIWRAAEPLKGSPAEVY